MFGLYGIVKYIKEFINLLQKINKNFVKINEKYGIISRKNKKIKK